MLKALAAAIASDFALGLIVEFGRDALDEFCRGIGIMRESISMSDQVDHAEIAKMRQRFADFYAAFDKMLTTGEPLSRSTPVLMRDPVWIKMFNAIRGQISDPEVFIEALAGKSIVITEAVARHALSAPNPLPMNWANVQFNNVLAVGSPPIAYEVSPTKFVGVAQELCGMFGGSFRMPCYGDEICLEGRDLKPQPMVYKPGSAAFSPLFWLIPRDRVVMLKGIASFVPDETDRKGMMYVPDD